MKNLPIGIQTFERMRTDNYIYVDKTKFVYDVAQSSECFFLSRPRRFGKSLFLGTLKSLFQGKKELFEGLWIYDKWDWSKTNPVIHFSFDTLSYATLGLEKAILSALDDHAERFEIELNKDKSDYKGRFQELIIKLYEKHGTVVFLVDEYDKPIIDYLEYEENGIYTQAIANQRVMKQFYSVLKGSEEYLRLTFITGVSKFTKVSVFSDLNHLKDISVDDDFATIVGYTQEELETNFSEYIDKVGSYLKMDRTHLLHEMKVWYNGFSWDGNQTLYNPFGILNFFSKRRFLNYWFSTGTPTFLLNQMKKQNIYDVENTRIDIETIESYDINNLNLISLLFQTGYLTIKEMDGRKLLLDYPNQEVRESMYRFMIDGLAPNPRRRPYTLGTIEDLKKAFLEADLVTVRHIISALLADLPYEVYDQKSEGLYHGLLHFMFSLLGVYIKSEVHSSNGRAHYD